MAGVFLTFEGGDGSGKTTQIAALADRLRTRGYRVVLTREPGGTELGGAIREALLHGGEVCPRAEALLYAADRAQDVEMVIRPALESGAIVLADRYLDSSVAYQGVARRLGPAEVRNLSHWATAGLMPAATILLDVPVAEGAARVGNERDRLESAGREFHEAVRAEYLALTQAEPDRWRVIDASGSVEAVAERVWDAIEPLLAGIEAPAAGAESGVDGAGAGAGVDVKAGADAGAGAAADAVSAGDAVAADAQAPKRGRAIGAAAHLIDIPPGETCCGG